MPSSEGDVLDDSHPEKVSRQGIFLAYTLVNERIIYVFASVRKIWAVLSLESRMEWRGISHKNMKHDVDQDCHCSSIRVETGFVFRLR